MNVNLTRRRILNGIKILLICIFGMLFVYKLPVLKSDYHPITKEELNAIENFDENVLGTDTQTPSQDIETASILYVIDGDTIKVSLDGEEISVRLLGIDTPEIHNPKVKKECYGEEAKSALEELLKNQTEVNLVKDSIQPDKDIYQRLLRYGYLPDGTDINAFMLEKGFAKVYTKAKSDRESEFMLLQEEAQNANLGLWSACK